MIALYTLTLLLSSALLFLVQPMVGKMILPALGGAPAVWNTCMVFFQAALLLGYAYAHASVSWLGVRRQPWLHLAVLAVPLAALPLTLTDLRPPQSSSPSWWLLVQLTLLVGPIFVVVAASGPLLQRWFAATGHRRAADPYFLYAASNVGSLGALLGYPLLVEPWLDVSQQSRVWTLSYYALLVLFGLCVFIGGRSETNRTAETDTDDDVKPGVEQRAWWVLAAFVPSSLMLGVTTHVTTNLAAIPLLWVLPLGLYLATFILVFATRPLLTTAGLSRVAPYLVLPLALLMFVELPSMGWVVVLLHLVTFFVLAMICHGQLAASRPPARRLTEFYLYMSLGGVLGGIFNALLAPLLFDHLVEYPLMIVIALLLRPRARRDSGPAAWLDLGLPALLGIGAFTASLATRSLWPETALATLAAAFLLPAVLCFACKERPRRFALGLGAMLLVCGAYANGRVGDQLRIERNFFGLKRVVATPDATRHSLVHGAIEHGSQFIAPNLRPTPLTYYHPDGPIGDLFDSVARDARRVGVVGLGIGSVAAYAGPGDHYTFFEIDPQVAEIAHDPRYFAYLATARGRCDVVLGDGRLTVADTPPGAFDLLLIDAFGSDAIPTHLLTIEALRMFEERLRAGGVLAIHISNRYLDLEPLLANAADQLGLACLARIDHGARPGSKSSGHSASHYVILARAAETIDVLAREHGWRAIPRVERVGVWTDRHTDLLRVVRWY